MGADLGAHSARTCSRRLSPAHLGTVLTSARTHSCRPPRSGNIPGGQGVAGSNPAVPTGQSRFSNAQAGLRTTDGSATRSHQFEEPAAARRVGAITPLVSGLPSLPKASPTRAHLTPGEGVAGSHPASRLVLGNTSRGRSRDEVAAPADAARPTARLHRADGLSGAHCPPAGSPGATVIRPARLNSPPDLAGLNVACSAAPDVLPAQMPQRGCPEGTHCT